MDIAILGEVLKGGADKVKESGAVVIGGHSIIDEEIKFGMAVTGVIHPDKIFRNVGVQVGDALVLTKPLGTGIVTTALKKGKASPESVNEAVKAMTTLNAAASSVMRKYRVHACSDVTGFGILGHALGMASGSGVTLVSNRENADAAQRRAPGRKGLHHRRLQTQQRISGRQNGHRQRHPRRSRSKSPWIRKPPAGF